MLTAAFIRTAPPGRHGDGGGLEFHSTGNGGKWIWRYSLNKKRREMGLGTYPAVSLQEARQERDKWKLVLREGRDPITERRRLLEAQRQQERREDPTLEELARMVHSAKEEGLRPSGRWMSPLETHVFPKIGKRPVSSILQVDIRDTLKPIWKTKHPTATKAIQRLKEIFTKGQLMGFECEPLTIDAARYMLGEVRHKPEHIASTRWQDIPALYEALRGQGVVADCLRFIILTVSRGKPARLARFDQIEDGIWTIPAENMKGREGIVTEFRIPLSKEALEIVEHRRQFHDTLLFPTTHVSRGSKPITDTALAKHLTDMGEEGRPHGFRTSFKTWVQDSKATDYEVSETILAHTIGGKVERSYARSDILERRWPVMEAWARHVTGESCDVIQLRR